MPARATRKVVLWMVAGFAILLACTVAAGLLLGVVERPDGSTAFDSSITNWVVAHRTSALTTLAKALSLLGSQALLAPTAVIGAGALLVRRSYRLCATLVAAWGGALVLYLAAKAIVGRHRPPQDIWLTYPGGTSFPSGHATQSTATFVVFVVVGLALASREWRPGVLVASALAAGVCWSRVYLGVHWTTDVAAGWIVGGLWVAIVVWRLKPVSGAGQSADQP